MKVRYVRFVQIAILFAVLLTVTLFVGKFYPATKHKILLLHSNGFGEQETVARLVIASQRLDIDLHVLNYLDETINIDDMVAMELQNFKPEFILSIEDNIKYFAGIPNYMTLTRGGYNLYLKNNTTSKPSLIIPRLATYDALLPSLSDFSLLKIAYEDTGKKFHGFSWYHTVYATNYEPAIPKKLFYSGGVRWDSTRSSAKYMEVFRKLDQTGYLRVCGIDQFWRHTPNSIIGFLPFDGKSVIAKTHEYGISLILHHKMHLDGGAPTSRIFEAAAANAVIISDRHPFLVSTFGDNILYIDIEQDAENLFKQIDEHVQWIFAHPEEAQTMSANCHAIVQESFTLEKQLQTLIAMHEDYQKNLK